jgi:phospholipid transport system substrate-binding protein
MWGDDVAPVGVGFSSGGLALSRMCHRLISWVLMPEGSALPMPVARRTLLISLAAAGLWCRDAIADDSPTAVIQRFCDALIAAMKAARGLSFDQRYQRLAPAVGQTYNLSLMSQLSVGGEWARLQPAQQQHLISEFSRYTVAVYANRFDSYNGQRFEVEPTAVTGPGGVLVRTQLVRADGTKLVMNYLMRQDNGGSWQAIDVYLSGTISELAMRRADFVAVLQKSGADGLLRQLDARTAELRRDKP